MINPEIRSETIKEKKQNEILVDTVLNILKKEMGIKQKASFSWDDFDILYQRVNQNFKLSASSITTKMARLFYGISYNLCPENIICLGSYQGNSLVWLSESNQNVSAVGIDIDYQSYCIAQKNFKAINSSVEIIHCDAFSYLDKLCTQIDCLLLDVDTVKGGKSDYRYLIEKAYDLLPNGAIVLAHDACYPKFYKDFEKYYEYVRNKDLFQNSLKICIDSFGVEVSKK